MKRYCVVSIGALSAIGLYHHIGLKNQSDLDLLDISTESKPIVRTESIKNMENGNFDVFIIGGGVTGCGCALDASSRGLKTALVDRFDFSSGTSSKSTKLLHGGVRYLEQAFKNLDYEKYKMCFEALQERSHLFNVGPHLASALPIVLPVYSWWELPYMFLGVKLYDFMSGDHLIAPSYIVGRTRCLELCPNVKKDGLKGAIVYYDGSHDDSRTTLSLVLTAITQFGATVANYVSVVEILLNEDGTAGSVRCKDNISGREFTAKSKVILNASGPYSDAVRAMSHHKDEPFKPLCCPSMGVHLTLPKSYLPNGFGMLKTDTSDGRLLFCLPWKELVIAGTTDSQRPLTDSPTVINEDVDFILSELREFLDPVFPVSHKDVLSVWSGFRPLVYDSAATSTSALARNHVIEVDTQNMVTIAGGKFTTFRKMAQEAIDRVVEVGSFKATQPCVTRKIPLIGAVFNNSTFGDAKNEIEDHLFSTYGVNAEKVLKLAGKEVTKLHPSLPYIEAEVIYACRFEMAERAVDVIARRTRISFLSRDVAYTVLDRVIELMARERGWNEERIKHETKHAVEWLETEITYI